MHDPTHQQPISVPNRTVQLRVAGSMSKHRASSQDRGDHANWASWPCPKFVAHFGYDPTHRVTRPTYSHRSPWKRSPSLSLSLSLSLSHTHTHVNPSTFSTFACAVAGSWSSCNRRALLSLPAPAVLLSLAASVFDSSSSSLFGLWSFYLIWKCLCWTLKQRSNHELF